MQFAHPGYLWFMLIVLPLTAWYVWRLRNRFPSMGISTTAPFAKLPASFRQYLLYAMFGVRMLLLCTLIIIIARPQQDNRWSKVTADGTDIVITLDISSSMLAMDFKPNRLEAAKKMAKQFIEKRNHDNIGLVLFSGEAFSAVPMTTDHGSLTSYLDKVETGMMSIDMTAIGDGLASAINRLTESKAKSKSIILLTDGTYNAGIVNPLDAADIARQNGIKVYTVGIGNNGMARVPLTDPYTGQTIVQTMEVTIDEQTLKDIARITDGRYFRATDNNVLQEVFDEIDKLEKSKINIEKFAIPEETYQPWAFLALALLAFELLCRTLILRRLP